MKGDFGEISLVPENADDVWHLGHLVSPGDLVFATTFRSAETPQDKLRPEKAEKRPVRLGIRVEKVHFHEYTGRLRIMGTIESGPEPGAHHTLNIEAGTELAIIRSWSNRDMERIERAVKASGAGEVLVLAIEDGEAQLYRMRQYGPEWMETIAEGSGKASGVDGKQTLFERVLARIQGAGGHLIVAGPGFVREDFGRFLRERAPALYARTMLVETRGSGRSAVREVIGKGALERLTGDIQLAREVSLMEEFTDRLARGEPVAYGEEEVEEAVTLGAALQVLVVDSALRGERIVRILEQGERTRARITVLSSLFEPGKQLESLGGIAAILRYRIR